MGGRKRGGEEIIAGVWDGGGENDSFDRGGVRGGLVLDCRGWAAIVVSKGRVTGGEKRRSPK